jgi:hypothetical protein
MKQRCWWSAGGISTTGSGRTDHWVQAAGTRDDRANASGLRSAPPFVHGSRVLVGSGTTIVGRSEAVPALREVLKNENERAKKTTMEMLSRIEIKVNDTED